MTGALSTEGNKAIAAEETAAKAKEGEMTLEEDDLFEEFAKESVSQGEKESTARLWAPEWEDEEVGDDFARRLKAELQKAS
eukprot:CAMPEP_0117677032 /NCGR_PEP_ID=MMETSP0804-20121206/16527_1 /TAXON_ID=1074897 /ORGANISM="Tetraselmis astigmatica, Strain CCMP880" /LENGTH=80 /DNA_ID=CAMNT_0005486285 /DNA_START=188 /DNA_END=430 /DNA_ORIENTATION=+